MSERRISEARESFSSTVNRVAYGGERVVLTRHGKRVAAVVPVEDLELLESLEDAVDVEEARRILAQGTEQVWVDWDDLKQRLGL
jgi:prevent-host-death family protein